MSHHRERGKNISGICFHVSQEVMSFMNNPVFIITIKTLTRYMHN